MSQDTLTIVVALPDGATASDAHQYASEWQEKTDSAVGNHIWHVDSLQWRAVDPAVDEPLPPDEAHRSSKPHVMARMTFGEAIEDEWLAVTLAMKYSRSDSNLVFYMEDTDGLFLLAEAAPWLPDWIDSVDMTHRALVQSGALHVLPPADLVPWLGLPTVPTLDQAASVLRSGSVPTCACGEAQEALSARTAAVYPHRCETTAVRHRARARLAPRAAYVLAREPCLVAHAVHAIAARDVRETAALQRMRVFPPTRHDKDMDKRDVGEWVTMPVRMTRLLFAQLKAGRFHPPKPWRAHAVPESDPAAEEADTGVRVTCGLELLALHGAQRSRRPGLQPEAGQEISSFARAADRAWQLAQEPEIPPVSEWVVQEPADDSQWIHEGAEELEHLLRAREEELQRGVEEDDSASGSGIEHAKGVAEEMESFLQRESGYEGVEDPAEAAGSVSSDDGSGATFPLDEQVHVDWARVFRLLQGEAEPKLPSQLRTPKGQTVDPEEPWRWAGAVSSGFIPIESDGEEEVEEEPADGEEPEQAKAQPEEEFRAAMAAMDAELQESTLPLSFARPTSPPSREEGDGARGEGVSLDSLQSKYNLAHSWSESVAEQRGQAGPASTILRQAGVHVPPDWLAGEQEIEQDAPKKPSRNPASEGRHHDGSGDDEEKRRAEWDELHSWE